MRAIESPTLISPVRVIENPTLISPVRVYKEPDFDKSGAGYKEPDFDKSGAGYKEPDFEKSGAIWSTLLRTECKRKFNLILIGCATSAPDGSSPRGYVQLFIVGDRLNLSCFLL